MPAPPPPPRGSELGEQPEAGPAVQAGVLTLGACHWAVPVDHTEPAGHLGTTPEEEIVLQRWHNSGRAWSSQSAQIVLFSGAGSYCLSTFRKKQCV